MKREVDALARIQADMQQAEEEDHMAALAQSSRLEQRNVEDRVVQSLEDTDDWT